jgi:hypothetical protein
MLQASTSYPLKRFALKVLFLSAFCLMQWRSGVLHSLALAFIISGNLSSWLAMMNKSQLLRERRFTYWDEAVAFFALSAFATIGARS